MEIKTKFNIGNKIWIVYRTDVEISMYVDTIVEISYNEDMGVMYFADIYSEEIKEDEVILEHEIDRLLSKILDLKKEIDADDNQECCDRLHNEYSERVSDGGNYSSSRKGFETYRENLSDADLQ